MDAKISNPSSISIQATGLKATAQVAAKKAETSLTKSTRKDGFVSVEGKIEQNTSYTFGQGSTGSRPSAADIQMAQINARMGLSAMVEHGKADASLYSNSKTVLATSKPPQTQNNPKDPRANSYEMSADAKHAIITLPNGQKMYADRSVMA